MITNNKLYYLMLEHINPVKPMMEVVVEKRFDIQEKSWENRVFTKLYHSLRTSGLLADLSDKDFKTLICLSTFMDAEGRCFPSQQALAKSLGISRPAATKRMKSLLAFRWNGKPLVFAKRVRGAEGKFDKNIYTVLPECSLGIFDNKRKLHPNHVNISHVADIHTNQSQTTRKIYNNVTHGKKFKVDPLALSLANDMGDIRNLAYYQKVTRRLPASILLRARGEVMEERNIKKSRGAMFAHLVKKHASEAGLNRLIA